MFVYIYIYTQTLCLPHGNGGFCIFINVLYFKKFVFDSVSVFKFHEGLCDCICIDTCVKGFSQFSNSSVFLKIIMYMCVYTSYAADFPLFIILY